MKKLESKKIILPLVISLLVMAVVNVAGLPLVTFTNQKYSDFIDSGGIWYNGLVDFDTNKSGELLLYKVLLIAGCLVAAFLSFRIKSEADSNSRENKSGFISIVVLLSVNIAMFITGVTSDKVMFASIFYLVVVCVAKEKANMLSLLAICSYYTVTGFISLTTVLLQKTDTRLWESMNERGILILSTAVFLICLYSFVKKGKNDSVLYEKLYTMQLFIPCNMFMYLKNRYSYGEEIIREYFPMGYYFIIIGIWMVLTGLAFLHFRKCDSNHISWEKCISISLVIMILIMNSYIVPAKIVPSDLWHHGEQITEWQQVISQGQGLYTEFFPSSGNFAFPVGAILNLFLDGKGTSYAAAYSLVSMLVAIVLAVLYYYLAGEKLALLLALITGVMVYNRGHLILPVLLLLTLPKVIRNRNLWLKIWILGVFCAGVYYPILGGSLLVATVPFGIVQIYQFVTREVKEKKNQVLFWVGWCAVIAVILCSSKTLFHMAAYILNLAGQSLEADSFTLLQNTEYNGKFMSWLPAGGVRYALYLGTRLMLPSVLIVLSVLLFFHLWKMGKSSFLVSPLFLALTSVVLFSFCAYSYTLLRADTGILQARTALVESTMGIYLIIVIYKFGKRYMTKRLLGNIVGILFFFLTFIFCANSLAVPNTDLGITAVGMNDDDKKLVSVYQIDETKYARVENTQISLLGNGFMNTDRYNYLQETYNFIQEQGLQEEYFVNLPRFDYYLLNVKAAFSDSSLLYQNYRAQQMVLENYRKTKPVVISMGIINYEILKWMQDSGYVRLSNGWYMCSEKIEKYHLEELVESGQVAVVRQDYGRAANAFGKSYDSLAPLFDRKEEISLNNLSIAGNGLSGGGRTIYGDGFK